MAERDGVAEWDGVDEHLDFKRLQVESDLTNCWSFVTSVRS